MIKPPKKSTKTAKVVKPATDILKLKYLKIRYIAYTADMDEIINPR